jgi:hypothetical protein
VELEGKMKKLMPFLVLALLVACEDKEKLCRAIAETSALSTTRRIYYQENCLPKLEPPKPPTPPPPTPEEMTRVGARRDW